MNDVECLERTWNKSKLDISDMIVEVHWTELLGQPTAAVRRTPSGGITHAAVLV